MRELCLAKSGISKIKQGLFELKVIDIVDSVKSLTPGEWCIFKGEKEYLLGYVNPLVDEKFSCAYVLNNSNTKDPTAFDVDAYITDTLTNAFKKRQRFIGYEKGSRLFYGQADGFSGLIIDLFNNCCLIQINTAGIDRHRDLVLKVTKEFIGTPCYFLDNQKYREKEFLPKFETQQFPDLTIIENDLEYYLPKEVVQKIGFYYDHRENRFQLRSLLGRLKKKPQIGLDLFCYAGAWGMNALKEGVDQVEFVDQGDFQKTIDRSLEMNSFFGRSRFIRSDVFSYLDSAIAKSQSFDLILCDPPAFTKNPNQKKEALDGYSKLHRKVFKIAGKESICAFSSCTHYVSHSEFQDNVLEAAKREGRRVQLLYNGIQGWDHPTRSMSEKSNYIKSLFYIVE